MTCSLYRLTLETAAEVVLDWQDNMLAEPELPTVAAAQEVSFAGAAWARAIGRGNKRISLRWSREVELQSHHQARVFGSLHAAALKIGTTDSLLVEIDGGGSWRYLNCVIRSVFPRWPRREGFRCHLEYEAVAGEVEVLDDAGLNLGL